MTSKNLFLTAALAGAFAGALGAPSSARACGNDTTASADKMGCSGKDKASCKGKDKADKDKASCQGKDKADKGSGEKASCGAKPGGSKAP